MVVFRLAALALALASYTAASPCPFGQMAEAGQLNAEDTAKFLKVRSDGDIAVEAMMEEAAAKQKRDHEFQAEYYAHQQKRGLLPFGGGLLNGALLPFTGKLKGIAVPAPQPTGLAIVPDKQHPFKAPKGTDVRGMCPTLNTMANPRLS